MNVDAAVVREQGQTFAVVVVRQGVIQNSAAASRMQANLAPAFDFVPIILMEQNSRGIPTYYGRPDIVRFLSGIDFRRLPWKQWSLN
jgi:hypothetical protein